MASPFQIEKNSDSLEPNNSQTGMEKVVGTIGTYVLRVANALSNVFYGANKLRGKKDINGIQRALDQGLIKTIEQISDIDFCNLFNYLANNKLSKGFNPNDPEPLSTDPRLKKIKYSVQMGAFKLQSLIDNYLSGGVPLIQAVRSINLSISSLVNENVALSDPELRKEYPEVDLIRNYLIDALDSLAPIANAVNIQPEEAQKIVSKINKIKLYCVAIQSLNNPAAIIGSLPNSVQKDLDKLNKVIKPDKFVPLVYRLIKTCNKINNTCRSILTYVSRANSIIKLAITLIRIFNIIKAFFLSLPVPNQVTTLGVTTKFSEIYQEKLKEQGEKKLIRVLKQVVNVLDDIYVVISGLIIALTDVIRGLRMILLNLQSCNSDPNLIKELEDSIKESENTLADLQNFINKVNEGKKRINNSFGEYTIEIVNEELVDEGIKLKRRYGIARGLNGIIAVKSTPTFATLDEIIINEVKVLLSSKGLVLQGVSDLSSDNSQLVFEAMSYLDQSDISMVGINFNASEVGEKDDIGLQSFVDNLPGGKALRKRVRKKLLDNSAKLGSDLKNVSPNQKV